MAKKTTEKVVVENLDAPLKTTNAKSAATKKAATGKKATASKAKNEVTSKKSLTLAGEKKAAKSAENETAGTSAVAKDKKQNRLIYAVVCAVCALGLALLAWKKWAPAPAITPSETLTNTNPKAAAVHVGSLPADTYIATIMRDDQGELDVNTLFALMGVDEEEDSQIKLIVDGEGHATMSVFGEQDTFSYDEDYFYTSDGSLFTYSWDGQILTFTEDRASTDFVPEANYVPPTLDEEALSTMNEFMQSLSAPQ